MSEDDFTSWGPRADLDDGFPAAMLELLGPVLLGEPGAATAALVGAYVLRSAAMSSGTRVKIAALDGAIERLESAVSVEVRNLCRDEARRVVGWCVERPPPDQEPVDRDRAVVIEGDHGSKASIARWAIAQELDVELEYYDETDDRWPRLRATPLRVVDRDDEVLLEVRTPLAVVAIPVANLRWLMPVERHERAPVPMAKVLSFPRVSEEE